MDSRKFCTSCQQAKHVSEFHSRLLSPDGLQCHCKACRRAAKAAWRRNNRERSRIAARQYYRDKPEKMLAFGREWRKKNPDKYRESAKNCREKNRAEYNARARADKDRITARKREYRKNNPMTVLSQALRRKYGITLEQWQEMVSRQQNKCAVCGASGDDQRCGRLDVDHCHETGVVRGLLCNPCNLAAAMLNDSVELANSLATYLGRNGATPPRTADAMSD